MFTIRRVGKSVCEMQRYSDHPYTWIKCGRVTIGSWSICVFVDALIFFNSLLMSAQICIVLFVI